MAVPKKKRSSMRSKKSRANYIFKKAKKLLIPNFKNFIKLKINSF